MADHGDSDEHLEARIRAASHGINGRVPATVVAGSTSSAGGAAGGAVAAAVEAGKPGAVATALADPRQLEPLQLRILLVSDIHCAVKRVAALADWISACSRRIDMVIVAGDTVNLEKADQTDRIKVSAAEGELSSILAVLENIVCCVAYIPGNHDPITTLQLDTVPKLSAHSVNVHNKVVRLAAGLVIAGFGGSTDGYRDGRVTYGGFPYTDEHIAKGLAGILPESDSSGSSAEPASSDSKSFEGAALRPWPTLETSRARPDDQVILLTHIGPTKVDTSIDAADLTQSPVLCGSDALRAVLSSASSQSRVLMNVHGHVHASPGQSWVGAVPIVNPGSLRYGSRFSLVTLVRTAAGVPWFVSGVEFHQL